MSIFGARVKTLRLDRGWSMKQLGEEISKLSGSPLPQTTVYLIGRIKVQNLHIIF